MRIRNFLSESVILLVYTILLIVISYFHEPWFDEAQAWLIARDSTLNEIIGSITHYEGHPPFWFLMLIPAAKSGIPYEIGLKSLNIAISVIAMGLFIFKAPFRKMVRFTIPFTYFFFYQYGVISRPYSMMMLGFVLSAICFKHRNERPFRYVASLLVICSSSAYGIIISAGIAFLWFVEILREICGTTGAKLNTEAKENTGSNTNTEAKENIGSNTNTEAKDNTFGNDIIGNKIKGFWKVIKERRINALAILFVINVIFLLFIYPFPDTYAANLSDKTVAIKLFYMFLIAPADAVCTYGYGGSAVSMVLGIAATFFIYYIMIKITRTAGQKGLFILPYTIFSLFSGMVYFSIHHVGIIALFLMFVCWVSFEKSLYLAGRQYRIAKVFVVISIAISLYWSAIASYNDVILNYGTGRELSKFIYENGMQDRHIMVSWLTGNKKEIVPPDYNFTEGVPALPYFNKNIFYNLNDGQNNKCYLLHKINSSENYISAIIDREPPDILIGSGSEAYSFGEKIDMENYALVKIISGYQIWKSVYSQNKVMIYIRKDLMKYYPYEEISEE